MFYHDEDSPLYHEPHDKFEGGDRSEIDGLLFDAAALADAEPPQAVRDYAVRRKAGTVCVDPLTMLELEYAEREHDAAVAELRKTRPDIDRN